MVGSNFDCGDNIESLLFLLLIYLHVFRHLRRLNCFAVSRNCNEMPQRFSAATLSSRFGMAQYITERFFYDINIASHKLRKIAAEKN